MRLSVSDLLGHAASSMASNRVAAKVRARMKRRHLARPALEVEKEEGKDDSVFPLGSRKDAR